MRLKSVFYCVATSCLIIASCTEKNKRIPKPNIIYILADDLGYGDLGTYGQEKIETPNIDRLADSGMKFTQHYAGSPVCAPSRCVLLTGRHSGNAVIRGNDEWRSRGEVWDYNSMIGDSTLEGQRPLPKGTITVASLLQNAGYKTAVVGKWGLGAPHTEGVPNYQGFDYFFGYNCQRQAHTYYPVHLYENKHRIYLNNDTVPPHTKLDRHADPYDHESYAKFTLNEYAPDLMFRKIKRFIAEHHTHPFFIYWATPIPHAPLQVPEKWIHFYMNKFGDEEPYLGENGYFPNRHPHATYAGMVSYLDEQVGQVIQQLKDLEIYENTLIIFSSDNGPTYNGGTDSGWFDSAKPFRSDRGWAKGYLREGGIRVPMIVSWPDKIKAGTTSDHISAFWDVLPTLCEIADIETDYNSDGISFLPTLLSMQPQEKHEFLYWEFPESKGQQAVRIAKWKGLRRNIREHNTEIELFDLEADLSEEFNIAHKHPEIVQQIERIMNEQHSIPEIDRFKMEALGDL